MHSFNTQKMLDHVQQDWKTESFGLPFYYGSQNESIQLASYSITAFG